MLKRVAFAVLAGALMFVAYGLAMAMPASAAEPTAACEHASETALQRSHVLAAQCASTPTDYTTVISGQASVGKSSATFTCNPGDVITAVSAATGDPRVHFVGDLVTGATYDPPVSSISAIFYVDATGEGGTNYSFTLSCRTAAV